MKFGNGIIHLQMTLFYIHGKRTKKKKASSTLITQINMYARWTHIELQTSIVHVIFLITEEVIQLAGTK